MSGLAEYSTQLLKCFPKRHKVPIIIATEENLKEYGRIVRNFKNYLSEKVIIEVWPKHTGRPVCIGTGTGGGVSEGNFKYWKEKNYFRAKNEAVDGSYTTGILTDNNTVLTREANYHPDGGQVFFPLVPTPFILLLALPGDDIKLEDFVGFYFDGTYGIQIYPNIWHQPIYPISGFAQFKTKQGAVHACVKVDTLLEFETWLEISLEIKNN